MLIQLKVIKMLEGLVFYQLALVRLLELQFLRIKKFTTKFKLQALI